MKTFKEHIFIEPKQILCEIGISRISKNILSILKDNQIEIIKEYQFGDKVIGLLKATKIGDQEDYKLNNLYPFVYTGSKGQYKPDRSLIPQDYALLITHKNQAPFHSGNIRQAEQFLKKIESEYRFVLAQDLSIDAQTLLNRVSKNRPIFK